MTPRPGLRSLSCRALTRLEVMVVLAVVGVLIAAVMPTLIRQKRIGDTIACNGRLKNIGLAHRIFATDNTNAFPFQISTNQGGTMEWVEDPTQVWRHFAILSNELSLPTILKCPSDPGRGNRDRDFRRFTNNADLSYFLGIHADDHNPQSILSGDSNLEWEGITLSNQVRTFGTNASVAFDGRRHRHSGNILLGDGSVQQLPSSRLKDQFRYAAEVSTNTLVIP